MGSLRRTLALRHRPAVRVRRDDAIVDLGPGHTVLRPAVRVNGLSLASAADRCMLLDPSVQLHEAVFEAGVGSGHPVAAAEARQDIHEIEAGVRHLIRPESGCCACHRVFSSWLPLLYEKYAIEPGGEAGRSSRPAGDARPLLVMYGRPDAP